MTGSTVEGLVVNNARPLVCLTFDDGPSSFRPQTLELLRALRVPAVFFEVGMRVRANPQLTRFAAADGHQVLNHTETHPPLSSLSVDDVRTEVLLAAEALADAGVDVPFLGLRPPMNAIDESVRSVLTDLGYLEVGATVWAMDWDPQTAPDEIVRDVLDGLAPGAVIVLHDGAVDTAAGSATLTALPELIAGTRARGYEFGLLDAAGDVVPASYVQSGLSVPALDAPVPYRALAVPQPAPPHPWVPMS